MNMSIPYLRDYYLKAADDNYVKYDNNTESVAKVLRHYKYSNSSIFKNPQYYDKNAIPLAFRGGSETLLILVIKVINTWELPSVYTWKIEEVCRWLRNYGYPQYQNTFRENLVNGRTLLLLDASALSAINIKDFDHIRHIAYGIRCLFHFEMAKFGRSISLPEEHYFELYKLLRVKNGTKYDNDIATSLWRRMQLVRQPEGLREHWETLHRWLNFIPDEKPKELIGMTERYNLFECRKKYEKPINDKPIPKPCKCMPPCECYWTENKRRSPWKMEIVKKVSLGEPHHDTSVLSVLYHMFPERYGDHHVRTSIDITYD